jgi:hypothetical protein
MAAASAIGRRIRISPQARPCMTMPSRQGLIARFEPVARVSSEDSGSRLNHLDWLVEVGVWDWASLSSCPQRRSLSRGSQATTSAPMVAASPTPTSASESKAVKLIWRTVPGKAHRRRRRGLLPQDRPAVGGRPNNQLERRGNLEAARSGAEVKDGVRAPRSCIPCRTAPD